MSTSSILDDLKVNPASFSATLFETPGLQHKLTVKGEATGDYRVENVELVAAHHQGEAHSLVLDISTKLGPVQNPHPKFERIWNLEYTENPAKARYTEIKIVNGSHHFTIKVTFAL
jgi:hypothetical protein